MEIITDIAASVIRMAFPGDQLHPAHIVLPLLMALVFFTGTAGRLIDGVEYRLAGRSDRSR